MRDRDYREQRSPDLLAEMGYETEDLKPGKFAVGAFWLFVFLGLCSVLGYVFIQFAFPKAPPPSLATQRRIPGSPVPLLQSNITRITDMMSLRQKETAALRGSAVVDGAAGVYRIPIDQAIDIISQRGLPKTPPLPGGALPPRPGGTDGR